MTQAERDNAITIITQMIKQLGRDYMPLYTDALDVALATLETCTVESPKPAQPDTVSPTTHICPVCSTPLESRGGYIRVIIGKPDMTSGLQGASWYCAECDRVWDFGDLPSIARQLADTDACDRLRWLLSQAERVVRVENADRAAVDRACRLMADIDNGFDRVRE